MKHIKQIWFTLLLAVVSMGVKAYDFEVDGIYYNYNGGGVRVTYKERYQASYSGAVTIPSYVTYDGTTYSVTEIGEYAFYKSSDLTFVEMPNSVTRIGASSFAVCPNLTSVTIPNSVTNIGSYAFSGCDGLTTVTIPEGITSIGQYAFDASGLTSIVFNAVNCSMGSLTYFYETFDAPVFGSSSNLSTVTIGDGVATIPQFAFCGCSRLESFHGKYASEDHRCLIVDGELVAFAPGGLAFYALPNTVTKIRPYTFYGNSTLRSVEIPNSVTTLTAGAFANCPFLSSVTLPKNMTSIDAKAFKDCWNLKKIKSLSMVPPSIGAETFYEWAQAEGVLRVPAEAVGAYKAAEYWQSFAKIQGIGEEKNVLLYTSSDENIVVPNNPAAFGANIVSNTYTNGLGTIVFDGEITSIGANAFSNCQNLVSVEIETPTVTAIGASAFEWCGSLSSVELPNTIATIGERAFADCGSSMLDIWLPDALDSIGSEAFRNCSGMYAMAMALPRKIRTIGAHAFEGCGNLYSLDLPNTLETIGYKAFAGCWNLQSVKFPKDVKNIGTHIFDWCGNIDRPIYTDTVFIFLPDHRNEWGEYVSSQYTLPDGITTILDGAFSSLVWHCDITLPNSITHISPTLFRDDEYGYFGCGSDFSITIPGSVKAIEEGTFAQCQNMTSVVLQEGVESIGNWAFAECENLAHFELPNSVTHIGEWGIFGMTNSLTEPVHNDKIFVYLPYSYTGDYAIPEGIETIMGNAFGQCMELGAVEIPASVKTIGAYAFAFSGLTSVNVPEGITRIAENTFSN